MHLWGPSPHGSYRLFRALSEPALGNQHRYCIAQASLQQYLRDEMRARTGSWASGSLSTSKAKVFYPLPTDLVDYLLFLFIFVLNLS